MRWPTLLLLALLPLSAFSLIAGWLLWTERNPASERELRITAQEQLEEWFPEAMSLPPELEGFQRPAIMTSAEQPDVILVHGLDEPGGIWDDLLPALAEAGLVAWEFRYPNDQAVDFSADLLADYWETLDGDAVYLVGHSMGGLVIRDFVSRWRHPVDGTAVVAGPQVPGVILVGTPNHGSDWSRFRAWLEIREWIADIPEGRLSPLAGLRHGTGAAKIDLRPDSPFLADLNQRPWPQSVAVAIIGGQLTEPTDEVLDGLDELLPEARVERLRPRLELWWREAGDGLGDGAVSIESLRIAGQPEPVIVPASHRGLLVRMPWSDEEPPAIALVVAQIKAWMDVD